ncbi:MAG: DegT/DnrJ/EryC1/StrS family aminotransferase [Bacteroidia bacterium]|nr:DegT/DnrJ/EryC1/StrS family aminotransferase [Bacteroidia bacterium]
MLPIQMVDLQTQYGRLKNEIDTAIQKVLQSAAFIKGPEVAAFETELQDFTGAKHVIACANGTDALQLAFMALKLQPGDEVITPSFSYAALAEVLHLLHLKPVFCEVDAKTFLLDPEQIEKHISPKTKAIAPVHLYGQICDMDAIIAIATKHQLPVVEDTAQAIGAVYTFKNGEKKQAGTMGAIGTTSFFPSKNLGCYGDGGAVFTNDDQLAKQLKMVANHGQPQKYVHEVIGINSRLDTLQAAILQVKLKYLKEFEASRNAVADAYDAVLEGIDGISAPIRNADSTHVFHQYTAVLKDAADQKPLMEYLKSQGIPSMIYYPTPLHKQQAYAQHISMPLTEDLCTRVISLPIHTEMAADQLQHITTTIKAYFKA